MSKARSRRGRGCGRVLAVTLLAGLLAGCGAAPAAERAAAPVAPEAPLVEGGTEEQRELLRSILGGMGSSAVARVEVRPTRPEWRPFPAGSVEVVLTPRAGVEAQRAYWEELLVGGAFRDRSAEEGLPPVVALEAVGAGSTRIAPVDAIRLDPPAGAPAPAEDDADRLAADAAAAAEEHGADVEEVEVLRPAGLAVALSVRVDDPARFLVERFRGLADGLLWNARYDGAHVVVRDRDGGLVLEAHSTTRVSAGGHRVRPDLEGCNPVPHSRPALSQPPPCPFPG